MIRVAVSFTALYTSQESFLPPDGLDPPSASTLGKKIQTHF